MSPETATHTKFYNIYVVRVDSADTSFVVKNWGACHTGGDGQFKLEVYDSNVKAVSKALAMRRIKVNRGYSFAEQSFLAPTPPDDLMKLFNLVIHRGIMKNLAGHVENSLMPVNQEIKQQEDSLWGIW